MHSSMISFHEFAFPLKVDSADVVAKLIFLRSFSRNLSRPATVLVMLFLYDAVATSLVQALSLSKARLPTSTSLSKRVLVALAFLIHSSLGPLGTMSYY